MMSAEEQAKFKARPVTTHNYSYLEESVRNAHEAFIVANVTSYPHDLVKRCGILLWEFMQKYILSDAEFEDLICSLRLGGKAVTAELESIHEQLMLAEQMLEECQDYNDYKSIGGTDNDKRART